MTAFRTITAVAFVLASLLVGRALATTANYNVTFDATWSQQTHPSAYPGGAHFSPLIGGVHNSEVNFWLPGGIATNGIELMAETGSVTVLRNEVEAAIGAGDAASVIYDSRVIPSPGGVSTTLQVSSEFPLVTLVTMIAPSPDWFVGVHDLDLRDGPGWKNQISVELFGYDSGTDDGVNFTSPNLDVTPHKPIALLGAPFMPTDPALATFTFTRIFAGRSIGDYNDNGIVDAADHSVWRDSLTQVGVNLPADGDLDGAVDADDYGVWLRNFGRTVAVGTGDTVEVQALAAPEPGALLQGAFAVLFAGLVHRRRL